MPEFVCSNCHAPPEGRLPGECDACHTQAGFVESASFLVHLAPENHVDATSEQCILCHNAGE